MTRGMKWLVAGLTLSLAANIFFIGIAIGKKVSGPRHQRPRPVIEFNLRSLVRALPPAARQDVREMLQNDRDRLRENFAGQRAASNRIGEIISADDVDRQALAAALDETASYSKALAEPIRRVFLEIVPELSKAERVEFAKKLRERQRFGRRTREPRSSDNREPHTPEN